MELESGFNQKVLQTMPGGTILLDENFLILGADLDGILLPDVPPRGLELGSDLREQVFPGLTIITGSGERFESVKEFYDRETFEEYSILSLETSRGRKLFYSQQSWLSLSPGPDGQSRRVLSIHFTDITARRKEYKALLRANRALRTIGNLRMAIEQSFTEEELYHNACRIMIQAGYKMVWIGLIFTEKEGRVVRPIARDGASIDYLDSFKILLDDPIDATGPTARAIATGEPASVQCLKTATDFEPWREAATKAGFHSSVALPVILSGGSPIGTLNIYSGDESAFDDEELELLEQFVADLSYSIETIRTRELHRKAEKEKDVMRDNLLRMQKMEAIGTMAGGIAHDFNNLLNIIKGYTQILLMRGTPYDDDLNEIDHAARKAAGLTKQLLLLGRQPVRDISRLNLNDMIQKNVSLVSPITDSRIRFDLKLQENLRPVNANEGQIDQVIINFFINAIDAMPAGGMITVETWDGEISIEDVAKIPNSKPGHYIILSVSDTGTGITTENIDKIFDPFFTTREPGKGTGMGLAVAQSVISAHKGWINVESTPGEGTSFRIYLPYEDSIQEKPDEKKSEIKDGGSVEYSGRILILEDEDSIRQMVSGFLEGKGYTIYKARNVQQAMEILDGMGTEAPIDLIFSDVVLPDGDGLSFSIHAREKYPELKFLFASGYTEARARFHDIQLHGDDYIQKPYDLMRVLEEIGAILTKKTERF